MKIPEAPLPKSWLSCRSCLSKIDNFHRHMNFWSGIENSIVSGNFDSTISNIEELKEDGTEWIPLNPQELSSLGLTRIKPKYVKPPTNLKSLENAIQRNFSKIEKYFEFTKNFTYPTILNPEWKEEYGVHPVGFLQPPKVKKTIISPEAVEVLTDHIMKLNSYEETHFFNDAGNMDIYKIRAQNRIKIDRSTGDKWLDSLLENHRY